MANFMNLITQTLGASAVNQIAKKMGVDSALTRTAISAALPLLISSLARNTAKEEGAVSLNNALENDHDGGLLDDLTGFLEGNRQQDRASNGAGILSHLFGERRNNVEQAISQDTGLDQSATGSLLETLAPIVLGQLGRQKRQENLNANQLAQLLQQERQETEEQLQPTQRNFLSSLLDKDGDGKIDDDIKQKGLGLLSNLFGRR